MGASKLVAMAMLLIAGACSGKAGNWGCASNKVEPPQLLADDVMKAKVGATSISAYDVARAIESSLGAQADLSPEAQKKVLESLVTSRALALARERELNSQDRAELEKSVARHREQLLVEQYIAAHYPPKPVSPEEMTSYYNEHAENFGAHVIRNFELLTSALGPDSQKQKEVLANLTSAAQAKDWKVAAAKSAGAGKVAIEYQTGTASDQVLHPRLRHTLLNLPLNQTSSTVLIERRAYVLRVTGESKTDPRPIAEVSDTIRKSLAARALKESVVKASADVRKRTRIEYPTPQ